MDIRAFFGKADDTKTKKKSSSQSRSATTSTKKGSSRSNTASSRTNHSTPKRTSPRKRRRNDSDSDDDFEEKKKTKIVIDVEDDDSTTDENVEMKTKTAKKSEAENKSKRRDKVEVSAEEYFSKFTKEKSDDKQSRRVDKKATSRKKPITLESSSETNDDDEDYKFTKEKSNDKQSRRVDKKATSRKKPISLESSSEANDDDEDYVENGEKDDSDEEMLLEDDDYDEDDIIPAKKKKRASHSPKKLKREEQDQPSIKRHVTKRINSSPKSSPPKQSSIKLEESDDHKPSTPHSTPSKPKPTKKPVTSQKNKTNVRPIETISNFSVDSATPGCLSNLTFVFTGVLDQLSREDAEDYVKTLGGRVTKAVSGKTNYLVCGELLEDGREVKEGSKYRKAKELGEEKVIILNGGGEFYGLVKLLSDECKRNEKSSQGQNISVKSESPVTSNPYAKKRPANPYAKKSSSSNPYAKKPPAVLPESSSGGGRADINDRNALWADKYAPNSTRDILGNQDAVRKLNIWLSRWEETFNNPRARGKSFGAPGGPRKAALLSGPPGIGKTTTALLVAREAGRDILELNASDARSKKALTEGLGDVTGSEVLRFDGESNASRGQKKKRCVIMDEVDGMGAGDRSGVTELIKMIKLSKVPIICICNDRQSQKLKSLVTYCLDLRFRRPIKTVIARRAVDVAEMENMNVEPNAAEAISESCGNDIRQVLNCMQMWSNRKRENGHALDMTYKNVKERDRFVKKDDILRLSMFDATRMIVEGNKTSLFKRSDAYFQDYSLMGLNVHQNYVKVMTAQFQETKRKSDIDAELEVIERMHEATQSMSDFALAEHAVRSGDQLWGLLPLCAILTCKTGHHACGPHGGFLPGYPEFAGWLGKNSSRSRKQRLLKELNYHMNYKVSTDSTDLRLRYVPAFREKLMTLMSNGNKTELSEVIDFMDVYSLDRDDIFENLDEFTLDSNGKKFADFDSKVKSAFTREYNKGIHKSQALVAEQGASKTMKKGSSFNKEATDIDVVNDDKVQESEEEEEDDIMDASDIQKMFQKKNGGKAKPKGGRKVNSRKRK